MSHFNRLAHRSRALAAGVGLLALGWLHSASLAQTTQTTPPAPPASAPQAAANAGGPTPLEAFFRRPALTEMAVSPNGRYLATTSSIAGRMNLVLIDLDDRKAQPMTSYDNIDVGRIRWVGDDWLLFSAVQFNAPSGQDSPRAGGLFSVNRKTGDVLQLAKTARQLDRSGSGGFFVLEFVAGIPNQPDEMIAQGVVSNDDSFDLYRVNLANGRYRILTQGRPSDRLERWILDSKNVARVALAGLPGNSTGKRVFYRDGVDAPWQEIGRFDETKPPATVPLAFDSDDKHLIVASNEGRKNLALFRMDPATRKLTELLAQHPRYDLGAAANGTPLNSLVLDPKTRDLIGLRIDADRPQTVWLDEEIAKVQATVDASLPGRINSIQRAGNGARYLVNSFSDQSPGRFFLYDTAKRSIEELGTARPWLEGQLAAVRPFTFTTRDGLQVPSYLVLPKGHKEGERLPTVVHIHGGPMARDVRLGGRYGGSFGVQEAQILASRGYAVVLPNFRVTPELGADLYYAGFGAYGRAMSDDHEDAAAWAVKQGFADPARMCISGASYGGYASLHAVSRPTNPFACAISGLPVTDLKYQRAEADYAASPQAVEYWRQLHGVPNFDDPSLRELSPLFNADRIKVPVFMYIGEEDRRTPPEQARRMADALAKAGNPVKGFFVGKNEGHGYGVEKTNVELYVELLRFLDGTIGPSRPGAGAAR